MGSKELDYIWAAGLLEGEGCFSIFKRITRKHKHCTCAIHCEMTDEDVINRLLSIFEVGTIRRRDNEKLRLLGLKRKDSYHWAVQNKKDMIFVLTKILPFMGIRRTTKIKELLLYLEKGEYDGGKSYLGYARTRAANSRDSQSIQQ